MRQTTRFRVILGRVITGHWLSTSEIARECGMTNPDVFCCLAKFPQLVERRKRFPGSSINHWRINTDAAQRLQEFVRHKDFCPLCGNDLGAESFVHSACADFEQAVADGAVEFHDPRPALDYQI